MGKSNTKRIGIIINPQRLGQNGMSILTNLIEECVAIGVWKNDGIEYDEANKDVCEKVYEILKKYPSFANENMNQITEQ